MLQMYISFNVSKTFLGNVPLSETQIRTRDLFAVCARARARENQRSVCSKEHDDLCWLVLSSEELGNEHATCSLINLHPVYNPTKPSSLVCEPK